jgi:hypothetical protein
MTILPKLHEIYNSAGLKPLTGHSTQHMFDWMDAPFTRFFDGNGIVGCAGLSLFEIMFLEHLRDYLKPKNILVIGNAHGWSTVALALTFPKAKIVAIDPYEPGIELTNKLAGDHKLKIAAVAGLSPQAIKPACAEHLDAPVDFVLIDAVHTNEAIVTDFLGAREVADDDCVYLFHDVVNWKMTEGLKQNQAVSGLQSRLLTRTPSGMAVLFNHIPAEMLAYLDCFSDNTQLLAAYRDLVRQTMVKDSFGEALASLRGAA